jgi:2-oxoisovalerate dehydrogenase E2 component (dihydrolipoyl transacylase)
MDFPLPPVGEGLFEVELLKWLVGPGDAVARGQPLAEVMSDKATMELPAPFAGTLTETLGRPGDKLKVGEVMLRYEPVDLAGGGRQSPVDSPPPRPASQQGGDAPRSPGRVAAAPSVRLLARKLGVDLAALRGSGPGGRVLLDDLTAVLAHRNGDAPKRAFDFGTPGTTVKLAGLRRTIAERIVASVAAIPHYTYVDECDFTELVRLREQLKGPLAARGVKLTYLPFVLKAVALALREVPIVNATHADATGETTLHARYNLGVAVAAPAGLFVPVVKDADRLDIPALAREIERLSADARAGRPRPEDLTGGTFTVTSIGSVGGLIATPVINRPEVGILAVGKVVRRPVYDAAGQVVPADLAYLSFSFDHRIIDGAVGASFGNAVLRHLHAPAALLLGPT